MMIYPPSHVDQIDICLDDDYEDDTANDGDIRSPAPPACSPASEIMGKRFLTKKGTRRLTQFHPSVHRRHRRDHRHGCTLGKNGIKSTR